MPMGKTARSFRRKTLGEIPPAVEARLFPSLNPFSVTWLLRRFGACYSASENVADRTEEFIAIGAETATEQFAPLDSVRRLGAFRSWPADVAATVQ